MNLVVVLLMEMQNGGRKKDGKVEQHTTSC